jgi:hypothetical protein
LDEPHGCQQGRGSNACLGIGGQAANDHLGLLRRRQGIGTMRSSSSSSSSSSIAVSSFRDTQACRIVHGCRLRIQAQGRNTVAVLPCHQGYAQQLQLHSCTLLLCSTAALCPAAAASSKPNGPTAT